MDHIGSIPEERARCEQAWAEAFVNATSLYSWHHWHHGDNPITAETRASVASRIKQLDGKPESERDLRFRLFRPASAAMVEANRVRNAAMVEPNRVRDAAMVEANRVRDAAMVEANRVWNAAMVEAHATECGCRWSVESPSILDEDHE